MLAENLTLKRSSTVAAQAGSAALALFFGETVGMKVAAVSSFGGGLQHPLSKPRSGQTGQVNARVHSNQGKNAENRLADYHRLDSAADRLTSV